jgi:receptor expression-enhancing protein 5/6
MNIVEIKKAMDEIEVALINRFPQLKAIRGMTGVAAVYFVLGALFLCFILFYLLSGLRAIGHVVAYIYPGWQSLRALNSQNREDDTLWLSYWVIYGFLTMFESITDFLLHRIPFYEFVKMGFYIYLYQKKGALVVYEHFLRPLVSKADRTEIHAKLVHVEDVNQQGPSGQNYASQGNFAAQANVEANQNYNNPTTSRNTRKQSID